MNYILIKILKQMLMDEWYFEQTDKVLVEKYIERNVLGI